MALDIFKWIILILIVVVTIGVIFGLIWGSLFEERAYDKRSKKEKKKNLEKNLDMAKGHTDNEETNGDLKDVSTKTKKFKDNKYK